MCFLFFILCGTVRPKQLCYKLETCNGSFDDAIELFHVAEKYSNKLKIYLGSNITVPNIENFQLQATEIEFIGCGEEYPMLVFQSDSNIIKEGSYIYFDKVAVSPADLKELPLSKYHVELVYNTIENNATRVKENMEKSYHGIITSNIKSANRRFLCFADVANKCIDKGEFISESDFASTLEDMEEGHDLTIYLNGKYISFRINMTKLLRNSIEMISIRYDRSIYNSDNSYGELIANNISLSRIDFELNRKRLRLQECSMTRSKINSSNSIYIYDAYIDGTSASLSIMPKYSSINIINCLTVDFEKDSDFDMTIDSKLIWIHENATLILKGVNYFKEMKIEYYTITLYNEYSSNKATFAIFETAKCVKIIDIFPDKSFHKQMKIYSNRSSIVNFTINFSYVKSIDFGAIDIRREGRNHLYSNGDINISFSGDFWFSVDVKGRLNLNYSYEEFTYPIKAESLLLSSTQSQKTIINDLIIANGPIYLDISSLEITNFTSNDEFPFIYYVDANKVTDLILPEAPSGNFSIKLIMNQTEFVKDYAMLADKSILRFNEGNITQDQVNFELISYSEKIHGFWFNKNDFRIIISDTNIKLSYGDILSIPLEICIRRVNVDRCDKNSTIFNSSDEILHTMDKVVPLNIKKVDMILNDDVKLGGTITISDDGEFMIRSKPSEKYWIDTIDRGMVINNGKQGKFTFNRINIRYSRMYLNGGKFFFINSIINGNQYASDCDIEYANDTEFRIDILSIMGQSRVQSYNSKEEKKQIDTINMVVSGSKTFAYSNIFTSVKLQVKNSVVIEPIEENDALLFGNETIVEIYPDKYSFPMIDLGASTEIVPSNIDIYLDLDELDEFEIAHIYQNGIPMIKSDSFNNCEDWIKNIQFKNAVLDFRYWAKCAEINNTENVVVYGKRGDGYIDICISNVDDSDKCPKEYEIRHGSIEDELSAQPFSVLKLTLINQDSQELNFTYLDQKSVIISSNKPIELNNTEALNEELTVHSLILTNVSLFSNGMSFKSTTAKLIQSELHAINLDVSTLETDLISINSITKKITISHSLDLTLREKKLINPRIVFTSGSKNSLKIDGINAFSSLNINSSSFILSNEFGDSIMMLKYSFDNQFYFKDYNDLYSSFNYSDYISQHDYYNFQFDYVNELYFKGGKYNNKNKIKVTNQEFTIYTADYINFLLDAPNTLINYRYIGIPYTKAIITDEQNVKCFTADAKFSNWQIEFGILKTKSVSHIKTTTSTIKISEFNYTGSEFPFEYDFTHESISRVTINTVKNYNGFDKDIVIHSLETDVVNDFDLKWNSFQIMHILNKEDGQKDREVSYKLIADKKIHGFWQGKSIIKMNAAFNDNLKRFNYFMNFTKIASIPLSICFDGPNDCPNGSVTPDSPIFSIPIVDVVEIYNVESKNISIEQGWAKKYCVYGDERSKSKLILAENGFPGSEIDIIFYDLNLPFLSLENCVNLIMRNCSSEFNILQNTSMAVDCDFNTIVNYKAIQESNFSSIKVIDVIIDSITFSIDKIIYYNGEIEFMTTSKTFIILKRPKEGLTLNFTLESDLPPEATLNIPLEIEIKIGLMFEAIINCYDVWDYINANILIINTYMTFNALDSFQVPFKFYNTILLDLNLKDKGQYMFCICSGSNCTDLCKKDYAIVNTIPSTFNYLNIYVIVVDNSFVIDLTTFKTLKTIDITSNDSKFKTGIINFFDHTYKKVSLYKIRATTSNDFNKLSSLGFKFNSDFQITGYNVTTNAAVTLNESQLLDLKSLNASYIKVTNICQAIDLIAKGNTFTLVSHENIELCEITARSFELRMENESDMTIDIKEKLTISSFKMYTMSNSIIYKDKAQDYTDDLLTIYCSFEGKVVFSLEAEIAPISIKANSIELILYQSTNILGDLNIGQLSSLNVTGNIGLINVTLYRMIFRGEAQIVPHHDILNIIMNYIVFDDDYIVFPIIFKVLPTRITKVTINSNVDMGKLWLFELYLVYPSLMRSRSIPLIENEIIELINCNRIYSTAYMRNILLWKWDKSISQYVHGFNEMANIFEIVRETDKIILEKIYQDITVIPMRLCMQPNNDLSCDSKEYRVSNLDNIIPEGIMNLKIRVLRAISIKEQEIIMGDEGKFELLIENFTGSDICIINPIISAENGKCSALITNNNNSKNSIDIILNNTDLTFYNYQNGKCKFSLHDSSIFYYGGEKYQEDIIISESGNNKIKSFKQSVALYNFVAKRDSLTKIESAYFKDIKMENNSKLAVNNYIKPISSDSSINLSSVGLNFPTIDGDGDSKLDIPNLNIIINLSGITREQIEQRFSTDVVLIEGSLDSCLNWLYRATLEKVGTSDDFSLECKTNQNIIPMVEKLVLKWKNPADNLGKNEGVNYNVVIGAVSAVVVIIIVVVIVIVVVCLKRRSHKEKSSTSEFLEDI